MFMFQNFTGSQWPSKSAPDQPGDPREGEVGRQAWEELRARPLRGLSQPLNGLILDEELTNETVKNITLQSSRG
jgi:hypothetical protein